MISFQVRIHSFLAKTKNYKRKQIASDSEEALSKEKEILRKRVNGMIKSKRLMEVQKLLKNEEYVPWGRDTQAKVCSFWLLSCSPHYNLSVHRSQLYIIFFCVVFFFIWAMCLHSWGVVW